jgi:hypothetical protein
VLGEFISTPQLRVAEMEGGVADRHFADTGAPSAESTLVRAIEDLANYARARHFTELDELLTELLAAFFAPSSDE